MTVSNIERHVACRLQCIVPDVYGLHSIRSLIDLVIFIEGTRAPLSCAPDTQFFSLIDECVPLAIASMPVFLSSFLAGHVCYGGTITTAEQLIGLRYCDTIVSDLIIAVDDPNADFNALHDIEIFEGFRFAN